MHIVPLRLDSDPSLIPQSCKPDSPAGEDERDPYDFRFWSEKQAKRISVSIKQVFGVEFAPEVVVAEANISSLTKRILVSKELFANV